MEHLPETRSGTVINKIKGILARHRKCLKFVSDNGPQYASSEFIKFASEWGFEHVTSSPTYPQSNGLAERTVLMSRRLRSSIPCTNKQLRPSITAPSAIESMLERKQTIKKVYYDKTAKDLPTLHSGPHARSTPTLGTCHCDGHTKTANNRSYIDQSGT